MAVRTLAAHLEATSPGITPIVKDVEPGVSVVSQITGYAVMSDIMLEWTSTCTEISRRTVMPYIARLLRLRLSVHLRGLIILSQSDVVKAIPLYRIGETCDEMLLPQTSLWDTTNQSHYQS